MKGLFVDTSGWMACADEADPFHTQARKIRDSWLKQGAFLVTTDYVMDETLTLLRVRLGLRASEAWWRQVEGSPRVRWEPVDAARAEKARSLFFQLKDKKLSFTDCTSFAVMRELKLKHALAFDAHFRQMGFHTTSAPQP